MTDDLFGAYGDAAMPRPVKQRVNRTLKRTQRQVLIERGEEQDRLRKSYFVLAAKEREEFDKTDKHASHVRALEAGIEEFGPKHGGQLVEYLRSKTWLLKASPRARRYILVAVREQVRRNLKALKRDPDDMNAIPIGDPPERMRVFDLCQQILERSGSL